MLELTANATEAIGGILQAPGVPDDAGLRIAPTQDLNGAEPAAETLQVSIVEQPASSDSVLEEAGARVFLQANVVEYLDDKLLDARTEEQGVHFMLAEQS